MLLFIKDTLFGFAFLPYRIKKAEGNKYISSEASVPCILQIPVVFRLVICKNPKMFPLNCLFWR